MDPEEQARKNIDDQLAQRPSISLENEHHVAASMQRVARLRQAVLKSAFEGRL